MAGKKQTVNPPPAQPSSAPSTHSNPRRSETFSLSLFDRLVILWLALAGWLHVVLGGIFVTHHATTAKAAGLPSSHTDFFHLFSKAAGKEPTYESISHTFVGVAQSLTKAYSCADSRFSGSDSTILAFESVKAYVVGPLCFFLAYAIAHRRGYRFSLQLVVSSAQLVLTALYFLTEHFNNYTHVNTKNAKCYYVYFWGSNLAFASVFALLFLQSFFADRTVAGSRTSGRKVAFTLKLVIGATLVGAAFILAVGVAHDFLEQSHVQKQIVQAVKVSQDFAQSATAQAQNVAQEGLKQAQAVAAPYVQQGYDFVKEQLGKINA